MKNPKISDVSKNLEESLIRLSNYQPPQLYTLKYLTFVSEIMEAYKQFENTDVLEEQLKFAKLIIGKIQVEEEIGMLKN